MKANEICILLTSTVSVNRDKVGLYHIDKEERCKLYVERIKQWLDCTNFNIVVVENSGYIYPELSSYVSKYAERFEICSYVESDNNDAQYLKDDRSKGCSELFSINYAYKTCNLLQEAKYIIKVTARYFVPELEMYLTRINNLYEYDAIRQHNPDRCELVGCRPDMFSHVFYQYSLDKDGNRQGHVEHVYKYRMNTLLNNNKKVLTCNEFSITPTQRGGVNKIFYTI